MEKPKPLALTEIVRDPEGLYNALRRTVLRRREEPLDDAALTELLLGQERALCILNTRRHAQALFARLYAAQPEGSFHLSTTMYARHRQEVVRAIRERLENRQPCRVVSTSLVEAGVDLDFDAVFREAAGLDSILQAAGRCNREGNRLAAESPVTVFTGAEDRPPSVIRQNVDAYRQIERRVDDLAGLGAVRAYFEQLYYDRGPERLDEKGILAQSNQGASAASFPFADLDRDFKLIDDSAQRTVYVLHRAQELEERLRRGERSRELFRALQPYAVSLYQNDFAALEKLGAVEPLDESVMLLYALYYDEQTGVKLSPEGGQAIVS